jgi:hypothetical protein
MVDGWWYASPQQAKLEDSDDKLATTLPVAYPCNVPTSLETLSCLILDSNIAKPSHQEYIRYYCLNTPFTHKEILLFMCGIIMVWEKDNGQLLLPVPHVV